jgi:hypothetical protein
MPATRRFTIGAGVSMLGIFVLGVSLAGCSSIAPEPSVSVTSAAPSSTASPAPVASFLPDGTARANKAWFDTVNAKFFAANGSANGRAIIDSLIAAGFEKAAMQVTPDKTSINGGVDSILFSVKIGDSCLLGQHGGGGYSSAVEAALKSGLCLVGKTRTIDW